MEQGREHQREERHPGSEMASRLCLSRTVGCRENEGGSGLWTEEEEEEEKGGGWLRRPCVELQRAPVL